MSCKGFVHCILLFKSIVASMNSIAMSLLVLEVHKILNHVKYIYIDMYFNEVITDQVSVSKVKSYFIWPYIVMFSLFRI